MNAQATVWNVLGAGVDAGRGYCCDPVMVTMGTLTGVEEEMVTSIWIWALF